MRKATELKERYFKVLAEVQPFMWVWRLKNI